MRRLFLILGVLGLTGFLTIYFLFQVKTAPAGTGDHSVDFMVKSGWGPSVVTSALAEANLIRSRTFFRYQLLLMGKERFIKKGIYSLNDGMSAEKVILIITSGQTKTRRVTIPEGYNNRQIGDVLTEKGFFASRAEFLEYASRKDILSKYAIPAASTEGYLFPETYEIPIGYPKEKIIETMIQLFFAKTKELKDFPADPQKRHELVILASIVEREAVLPEERALVAGVFANRMEQNYPLESCATIQYTFEKQKKRIYFKDLEVDSPYNTYKVRGLPPGPIANPGLAAVRAALDPIETDYKFFVVKGDGSHQFSKSYGDHVRAKSKYLGP